MNDATGPAADPAEILRLSETATPGPWKQKGGYVYRNPADPHNANGFRVDGASSTADAEFIAALRNAAPGLCRRLRAAEGRVAALSKALKDLILTAAEVKADNTPEFMEWLELRRVAAARVLDDGLPTLGSLRGLLKADAPAGGEGA